MSKLHPIFEKAMAPFLKPVANRNVEPSTAHMCTRCGNEACACSCKYDEDERTDDGFRRFGTDIDADCDYDPTPWCGGCGAMRKSDCHCGPLADNE